MRILLIKMSSLGDVVHALTGVTDAARALPGVEFDWVVEEAYADIPAWHPSVRRVITCALRQWRKSPVSTMRNGSWARFQQELRQVDYDLVLDAQGLIKSGFVARQARGPIAGRTAKSAREAAAALFYQHTCAVDLALTEVEQLRQLFALALKYPRQPSAADFGIDPARLPIREAGGAAAKTIPLMHGAGWKTKLWREENWIGLARALRDRGFKPVLPWGSPSEYARAGAIAAATGAEILPKLKVNELAALLRTSRFVVGLDTGLTHIAIALGVPTVTLYGPSVPVYTEVAGGRLVNLCSGDHQSVDTRRPNTVPLQQVLDAIESWCV